MLSPAFNTSLKILKLDHNPIGSKGLQQLAMGIGSNSTLQELSLNYCNLDIESGIYI